MLGRIRWSKRSSSAVKAKDAVCENTGRGRDVKRGSDFGDGCDVVRGTDTEFKTCC